MQVDSQPRLATHKLRIISFGDDTNIQTQQGNSPPYSAAEVQSLQIIQESWAEAEKGDKR